MKQKSKLITYLAGCAILVSASLYAGRNTYNSCDKCHYVLNEKNNQPNILTSLYKNYPAGIKP